MTILGFLPAVFTLMVLMGVTWKIFVDRDMSIREGAPMAVLFVIWGYLQVRVSMHYDQHLESQTIFIAPIALLLLAQYYSRKQLWRNRGRSTPQPNSDDRKV